MSSLTRHSRSPFRRLALILTALLVLGCFLLLTPLELARYGQPLPPTPGPTISGIVEPTQLARANTLVKNPEPTPRFIDDLKPEPGYSGPFASNLCLFIWAGEPFTTLGDRANDLDDYMLANTVFFLDGKKVETNLAEFSNWLVAYRYADENGHEQMAGGPLESCYDVSPQVGLHVASLQIKSTSGKVYSYTWAFKVQSTDPVLYSVAMTATSRAFDTSYETNSAPCNGAAYCPTATPQAR